MYAYIHIRTYTLSLKHTRTHTHMYICIHIHIYIHMHTHIHIHIYMYLCIHTHKTQGRSCNALQHSATHCITTAMQCNKIAMHCNNIYRTATGSIAAVKAGVVCRQSHRGYTATHCNALQHTPLQHNCNTLQLDRDIEPELCVHDLIEDTLQHTATHSAATHLQHTATESIAWLDS